jgi:hypothetical protein
LVEYWVALDEPDRHTYFVMFLKRPISVGKNGSSTKHRYKETLAFFSKSSSPSWSSNIFANTQALSVGRSSSTFSPTELAALNEEQKPVP